FLYDEPDVFLHPRWQREFIPFLRSYFNNSFALLTTHNPALLSDVNREQVILFRNGKIINKTFRTLGKEYDRLLVDYFGLEHTRSIEASKLFESLHNQIRENSQDKESFKINFEKLQEMVGKDDKDLLMLNFAFRKANEKN
uniref:AAA family ATPase n=1 Tax=Flavobacterium sp. TaxID=239 RepID=UPI0039E2635D